MPEPGHDPVPAAFDAFRAAHTGQYRPLGLPAVVATARRRRRIRRVTGTVLAVAALMVPTALLTRPGREPAPPAVHATPTTAPASGPAAVTASPDAPRSPDSSGATGPTVSRPPDSGGKRPSTPAGPPGNGGAPAPAGACVAAQLAASPTGGGSVASQPFVTITLRNTSGSACRLTGYAGVTAAGYPAAEPGADGPLDITVVDGPLYARADPGPQGVQLAAGGGASFSIGTGTAYDDRYTITSVRVSVPGGGALTLDVTMAASAPAGRPIPVGVTGFAADPS
jgi:hypothetical protein